MANDHSFATEVHTTPDCRNLQVGDVLDLRPNWGFMQVVILGFTQPDKHGDVYMRVARPYAYPSCVGSTGPTVLLGHEIVEGTVPRMLSGNVPKVGRMSLT